MKKSLTTLFVLASFAVALIFAPSLVQAANSLDGGGAGKSSLQNTGNGAKIKAVEDATIDNKLFNQGQTNFGGAAGYWSTSVVTNLVLCNFEQTGCTGDPNQTAPITSLTNFMADMYTPQATIGRYVADLMNSAGLNIAQPAYAQGLGFASLDPILDTWKVFRNVAYLFYVILFLVIGFMIMFRQKISSQAVVTAQQALPNIIVSLIAVTFSYAIAGLLIDMMYVIMYLILGLFPNQTFGSENLSLRDVAMDKDIFSVGLYLLTKGGTLTAAYDSVRDIVQAAFSQLGDTASNGLGIVSGITFAVVFALATLFGIFKLFFELLKTYISIIIAIILSPLALMLGALPGNNAFRSWLRSLIANLAVFPGILIILALSFMLIGNAYSGPQNADFFGGGYSGGFLPPYIPGAGSGNAISVMLGLGVILILPDLASSIKKTLGGSGGIFEQFANNFTSALEKGWKGGELVPGIAASNTNLAGLSGRNLSSKMFFGTKESRERADKGQYTTLGRGVMGGAANAWSVMRRRQFESQLADHVPHAHVPERIEKRMGPEAGTAGRSTADKASGTVSARD
jgi:hypothetical protein